MWQSVCNPTAMRSMRAFLQRIVLTFIIHCCMNLQPGKPLFVSVLVYLNASWPMEHDAETLAVDIDTDTGVFVRPKPGRIVLMDQVSHLLSCLPGGPLTYQRPQHD